MAGMIIKAIKQLFETQTSLLQKKANTFEVECAIDEDVVDCKEMDTAPYTGVPAPVVLSDDPWFGAAVKSEKQLTHEEMLEIAKEREEENCEPQTKEPENIHEVMYEIATKNAPTTVQIDPVGGSETFQEGPGGWMSGTGYQGQGLTNR